MAVPRSQCICLFFQIFLWSLLLLRTCTGSECKGSFDFPELNTTVWTAKENTTITLNFRLKYSNCELPDNVTIILKKKNKESGRSADFCTIHQRNGLCRIPLVKNGCGCDGLERGLYQLERTVNRSDNAVWIWTSADERVEDRELIFNILHPAEVQNLTISGDHLSEDELVAEPDDVLDVVCLFEKGNPPVTARLLDRHGVEMEGSIYSSGQIRYNFPQVSCQDAGLIRCEVPGASRNQSVMLLVKCAPQFKKDIATNVTAFIGQALQMDFPFRAFTKNATVCQINQLATKSDSGAEKIDHVPSNQTGVRSCVLFGTPPDLIVTVSLENVTKHQFGRWRVELTNDAGNGQLDFYILEPEAKKPQPSHKLTIGEITTISSAGTVFLIIMCVCIANYRKKGCKHTRNSSIELDQLNAGQPRIVELPEPVAGPSNERHSSAGSAESNPYDDASPDSDEEERRGDYLHPAPSSKDRRSDHIHPVPTEAETYERPVQPDYVPLNPLYEPLRHVYDNLVLRVRRAFVRN